MAAKTEGFDITTISTKRASLVENGKEQLTRALAESIDPPRTIREFRNKHDLGSQRCDALLELYGLMNTTRAEMYRTLLESLVKKLELAIPLMSKEQQDELLKRTFPFITISDFLRTIPINLLKRRGDIPTEYLHTFASTPSLREVLEKLPVLVQQQVWESQSGLILFEAHVLPFFESYRLNLGQRHLSFNNAKSFSLTKNPTGKLRAKSKALSNLTIAIGSRVVLFDVACRLIFKKFKESSTHVCGVWAALLSDLLLVYETVEKKNRPANIDKRLRCARLLDQALRDAVLLPQTVREFINEFRDILPQSKQAPVMVANKPETASQLKSKLEGCWDALVKLDTKLVFSHAVTEDVAPGYNLAVKTPMDLSLMRTKIGKLRGGYSSLDDLNKDVELMVANCIKYNLPTSTFGKYAHELLVAWKAEYDQRIKKLGPAVVVAKNDYNDPAIVPPQILNDCEAQSILLILAQSEVTTLLTHTLAASLYTSIQEKALPGDTPVTSSLLQLLQISHHTHGMFQVERIEIPPLNRVALRQHFPMMCRLLSDTRDMNTDSVTVEKDNITWKKALTSTVSRSLFMTICGASLIRPVSAQHSDRRALSSLSLLTEHADYALSQDDPFLNALEGLCDKPRSLFRKKEVRSKLLAFLVALIRQGGILCRAHGCLVRVMSSWASTKLAPLPTSAAAASLANNNTPQGAAWISAAEVDNIISELSGFVDGVEPPTKRLCSLHPSAPPAGKPSLLAHLILDYDKLEGNFPQIKPTVGYLRKHGGLE